MTNLVAVRNELIFRLSVIAPVLGLAQPDESVKLRSVDKPVKPASCKIHQIGIRILGRKDFLTKLIASLDYSLKNFESKSPFMR